MKNKPDYWYNQSSVIPFKINGEGIEILLIRTRKNKKWIFPKGIIEQGMSPRESAKKETLEEAGVVGSLLQKRIGKYTYKKWEDKCTVKVYGMKVENELEVWEEDFRSRMWIKITDAEKYITSKKILKIIKKLELNLNGRSTL